MNKHFEYMVLSSVEAIEALNLYIPLFADAMLAVIITLVPGEMGNRNVLFSMERSNR